MPILFCAIAETEVIAEYPSTERELSTTVQQIVQKLARKGQKQSFTQDQFQFHTKCSGNFVYICVADGNVPLRSCYALLSDIETRHSNGERRLKQMLKDRITFYNDSKNDKIIHLQDQIEDVKGVMMDNIDKVIQRSEKLEEIQHKAEALEEGAADFNRGAKKVKQKMFAQNIKLLIILILIILAIIAIVIVVLIVGVCATLISCKL